MHIVQPTPRQREIEQSFVCKKPAKVYKKHYLKKDVFKAELLKRGKRLYDVAEYLGLSTNAIYNCVQGLRPLDEKSVNDICRRFKMSRKVVAELR